MVKIQRHFGVLPLWRTPYEIQVGVSAGVQEWERVIAK